MAETQKCPTCGEVLPSDSPGGHCPHCLIQLALNPADSVTDSPESTIRIVMPEEIPLAEKPGDRIGRYKLLQQIGEGGCGVVYMADQSEPVRRRVALKVIKPGMDSKQVLARFEAERQALALMDHPNIAKVLDAGATENSRPYFVMELVKGIPITRYCDEKQLTTESRLNLFVLVCQAIQHAHQKGIIHRDIKPSNILVADHDGTPVPKIIDFGIAKATTDQRLTDKTLFTAFEQFIGTPAYMSPEQATLSGLDIDTRSDIYSLGVLLYELLTGRMPFDARELLAKGLDEIRRVIREVEPQRPSTRLSTLEAGEQATVAHQRQCEPPKLKSVIRGDLDWIVMKALEKDRARRYETANGLAADIQRHLDNEPVVACPPSNVYRFLKMVKRNKAAVVTVVAVTLALLLGIVASTLQAARALRAEREAKIERNLANSHAEAENHQREVAEKSALEAIKALSTSITIQGDLAAKGGSAGKALAFFAKAVSLDVSNRIAAQRIVCMLNQRDFPLPLSGPPAEFQIREPTSANARELVSKLYKGDKGNLFRWSTPTLSPDGQKLAFITDQNKTIVISTQNGEEIMPEIPTLTTAFTPFVRFSPDNQNFILSGGLDGIQIYNLKRQKPAMQIGAMPMSQDIDFSHSGLLMVSGARNGESRIWDFMTGQLVREPCPGAGYVSGVSFGRTEAYISSSSQKIGNQGSSIKYWDIRPGRAIPVVNYGVESISNAGRRYITTEAIRRNAMFSKDGKLVAARTFPNDLRVFSVIDGAIIFSLTHTAISTTTFDLSSDSKLIAVGDSNGGVTIWSLDTGNQLKHYQLHSGPVSSVLFDHTGTKFVSGSEDGTAKIVELISDTTSKFAESNEYGSVMGLALSPDDKRLAVCCRGNRAEIFEVDSRQRVGKPLVKNQGWVWSACFSHDGKWLTTSSGGNSSQLWDGFADNAEPKAIYPHGSGAWYARFSADDKMVVTCAYDFTARIWDTLSGQPISEPLVHDNKDVNKANFSPDGRKVITASDDGTAIVWDVMTGQKISEPFYHTNGVHTASFSPDGRHVLTAGTDGTVCVYDWVDVGDAAPPWLSQLAELVGGYRLKKNGVTELVANAAENLTQLRSKLDRMADDEPLVKWGRWFLADRSNRTISPFSRLTVKRYAEKLAGLDLLPAIREAVSLDPQNPYCYERLALFTQTNSPETAAYYREIASYIK
jgi:WD40 repeat protein/tRNA A-37 threonylcarbamoyl transferase component Bud32